jgi:hypothetical protein
LTINLDCTINEELRLILDSSQLDEIIIDDLVKSPPNCHTGNSRYPEGAKNTGFRVKPGMTKEANGDFLRVHHYWKE